MQDVFIAGYSDKLSARPGETVTFFVSSHARESFRATLHRSISADPNPDGPGIIEDDASTYFNPSSFASRYQGFIPGSYAQSTADLQADIKADLVIKLWFMPKVLLAADQTLLVWGTVSIILNPQGMITAKLADGMSVSTSVAIKCNHWHSLEFKVSASGVVVLDVKSIVTAKADIEITNDGHKGFDLA